MTSATEGLQPKNDPPQIKSYPRFDGGIVLGGYNLFIHEHEHWRPFTKRNSLCWI